MFAIVTMCASCLIARHAYECAQRIRQNHVSIFNLERQTAVSAGFLYTSDDFNAHRVWKRGHYLILSVIYLCKAEIDIALPQSSISVYLMLRTSKTYLNSTSNLQHHRPSDFDSTYIVITTISTTSNCTVSTT